MNKKALYTLEYNKIIEKLMHYATSEQGLKYCQELLPIYDKSQIEKMQKETSDALTRIFKKGSISFRGSHDVGLYGKRLEIGGVLNSSELLRVASLLEVAKRAKSYGRREREDEAKDSLDDFFLALEPLTPVCEEIRHCIIGEDEFADDASPGLKNVRRSMASTNERIRSQMNTMLNNTTTRGYLQDGVITMRNGRYCLPVRAEFKNQVAGMIHDQSSTGATLFIEPMAVVNLNNQLRELQLQEEEEIEKILSNLSNLVAEHVEEMKQNFDILSELDFIFAKGMLAKEMNGVAPIFNTQGIIHLRGARHPLLNPKQVVPIDLRLGEDFNLLIVTGPNTGGKTVSLKTCGLLTLMGQAGLHIPTLDRSQLAIFHEVFADIGDEQSIEQSLSTFSSHMTNIVHILKEVANSDNALILFDELCAGTDPAEGAALATAILSRLHQRGIRTMATTHYSELKVYALTTPGVENACCEFSLATLSPTYRLLIGIPGKSNAFAISKKLGLAGDIIDSARAQMDENDQSFEDLLVDLEQKRVAMENDRRQIQSEKDKIAAIRRSLDERQDKLDTQRNRILEDANMQAATILKNAKDTADETIRNFHKYGKAMPDMAAMERERAAVGKKLSQAQAAVGTKKKTAPSNHQVPKKLRVGDSVKVLSMNLTGTVHTLPDARGNLQVQMGILTSNVNIRDLVLINDDGSSTGKKGPVRKTGGGGFGKAATISPEINLLGKTGDEAVALLDKYLDDAYISHLKSVRVVHGKGTGALRKAVHQYLRKQKIIDEYHLAEFGEGDSGVTIVVFK